MSITYFKGSTITGLPSNTDPLSSLDRIHIAKRVGSGYVSVNDTLGNISSFVGGGGGVNFNNLPVYENNSDAVEGGLIKGMLYRTSDGTLKVVFEGISISCAGATYYSAIEFDNVQDLIDVVVDGIKIATQVPIYQVKDILAAKDIEVEFAYLASGISCTPTTVVIPNFSFPRAFYSIKYKLNDDPVQTDTFDFSDYGNPTVHSYDLFDVFFDTLASSLSITGGGGGIARFRKYHSDINGGDGSAGDTTPYSITLYPVDQPNDPFSILFPGETEIVIMSCGTQYWAGL